VSAGLAALLGILGAARVSFAQSDDMARLANLTLEELMNVTITTASRASESVSDAPAQVQVITAAEIERRGYRSLLDVLKDLPDIKVDLRGNWDFPSELTIQGVRGASRIVLLLDGVRVSPPTNEPLPIVANYPVHTARQIEIVYGPASALYGADAFSAVINIITKVPSTDTATVSTSVGAFGLIDQTASVMTPLAGGGSLIVAAQFQHDGQPDLSRYYPDDFQGLEAQRSGVFPTIFGVMTPGQAISPDYHIPMWARSFQSTFRRGGLQLMFFENRSHLPTTAGTYTPDNAVYNDISFNENALQVGSGSLTRSRGAVTSQSTLSYSRHTLDPKSGYMDLYSNMTRSYKYAFGSVMEADEQLSWAPSRQVRVTTGGSFARFFAIPQTADLNAPITSGDSPGTILGTDIVDPFIKLHYSNSGVFGQLRYARTQSVVLTAGARADYNTRYGATFNPRVGVVMQASPATVVKVLYGTAFLAPSPYQAYQHYGSFLSDDSGKTYTSAYWHLPNPDLRPQHKKTVEANLEQRLGHDFSVSGSVFYSRFTDLIKPIDPDSAFAGTFHGWPVDYIDFPINEGKQTTYGTSVLFNVVKSDGQGRQIAARAGVSYVGGRIWPELEAESPDSMPIGAMAPLQFRAGADIDWGLWGVAPRVTGSGRQRLTVTVDNDPDQRQTLDGYWTVDLTVRRRRLAKSLDGFVMLENAFDQRYRSINERAYVNPEEFIGIPQNPRRLSAGLVLHLK
jgi:outer membrane cobalamin receptor